MNKLDRQFEQMMKETKIDSPSEDFRIKVMSRILAEAAVTRRVLQDYKPVISKRTWIILIGAFVALVAYIIIGGIESGPSSVDQGVLSTVADSVSQVNASVLKKGYGLFSSIPTVAYLIILASLSLWTLDSFLSKLKHYPSKAEE
jgi:hypothetical protein